MTSLTFLSLFSGIGGLDLGLERAGLSCVGQVEIDPFCRRVLAKHWPEVPRHDDVRTAAEWWAGRDVPDVVVGGFPCQPFSQAGVRRGIADGRWLWPPMFDVVRSLRPRYVLVENVPALIDDSAAFGTVLADLASVGFDADWSTLCACQVGAPHARERLFLVAYAADGDEPCESPGTTSQDGRRQSRGSGLPALRRVRWLPEPDVDRVAHGIPHGLVRDPLHAFGNAVVPQVAEYVGRLLIDAAERAVVTSPVLFSSSLTASLGEGSGGLGGGRGEAPQPPRHTRTDRSSAHRWDDLDEIAVERAVAGDPPPLLTRAERVEAVRRLRASGASTNLIAARLRIFQRQVCRDLQHLGLTRAAS